MGHKKVPRVGIAVLFSRDGRILLGKRHDDPAKADSELHGEGTWTIPGGKLDFHEKPSDGARREAIEECGLKPGRMRLISVSNETVPDAHFITLGFLCEDFEGEARVMEPDEITEWGWFKPDGLPGSIFPPTLKVIKNFLDDEIYKH